jgi:hypothetical protein
VHAVEELEELAVRDLGWVEDDVCGFGVFLFFKRKKNSCQ